MNSHMNTKALSSHQISQGREQMEFSNVKVSVNNYEYIVANFVLVRNDKFNTVFILCSGYAQ